MLTEKYYLYDDREDVFVTTYIIEDSIEMLYHEKRPLVLICPGGAYLNCSDREAEPVALRFASMGYHAAVLRYTTYGERRNDFAKLDTGDPVKTHTLYPTQMREIGKTFLYLREHAGEWNIDMDQIILCGFSAGGHNAAMYATSWHKPVICDYLRTSPEQIRPAAAILCYALTDYYLDSEMKREDPWGRKLMNYSRIALMGTTSPSDEVLKKLSPDMQVDENTPPMFLWTTSEDNLVDPRNTIRMANALAEHRIPFELHVFEKGGHGLSLADQSSSGAEETVNMDVQKWTELADAWLKKRFALRYPAVPFEQRQ